MFLSDQPMQRVGQIRLIANYSWSGQVPLQYTSALDLGADSCAYLDNWKLKHLND